MLTRLLLLGSILLSPSLAFTQSSGSAEQIIASAKDFKQMSVLDARSSAPRIDGRLDDEIWAKATWTSDFLQREPLEGSKPSDRTEVAISYDDQAIYIAARMFSSDPANIRSVVARRDSENNSEQIAVSLDSYLDRRTAYTFAVSAAGVRIDYFHGSDEQDEADYSFDPVWSARTNFDSQGWTAEMRIPFSQLRFTEGQETWGINISRKIPAKNENIYWIMIPKEETGWSSRFGLLTGLKDIRSSRRIELLPYTASSGILRGEVDSDDPFLNTFDSSARAGLDLKMGLGSNLTLDATINPDFGQVEADPAEVNLSAFETFFPERRPFFTEGSDLLGGLHFYSRRIGTSPRGRASGDYVEYPSNTTILGATKITGRLASGLSINALAAATQKEFARTFDSDTRQFGKTKVEPTSGYLAVAAQQELGSNGSSVGLTLTSVQRLMDSSEAIADVLNNESYTAATETVIRFRDGDYILDIDAGVSHVRGTSERISALQKSSVHYYQRPDASHVNFDSSRTSLSGFNASTFFRKNTGAWTGGFYLSAESPGIDTNDIGRFGKADDLLQYLFVQYRDNVPSKLFQHWDISANSVMSWNSGGQRQRTGGEVRLDLTWSNFWSTGLEIDHGLDSFSDTMTRGGPRMGTGSYWATEWDFSGNPARRVTWEAQVVYDWNSLDRRIFEAELELGWQPGDAMQLSLGPNYSQMRAGRQYIGTRSGGPTETFGTRYVFSLIDRSTLSTQLRLDYTFTPNLSLELYAEPFAASGKFYDFGELDAAESQLLNIYGEEGTTISSIEDGYEVVHGDQSFTLPQRDFNLVSFRSNAVLRWEWRPGSTLYALWQQDRSGFNPVGDFVTGQSLVDAFQAGGDNFFGIKLSYWLGK